MRDVAVREQAADPRRCLVVQPFVGIQQQHPGLGGAGNRGVLLCREPQPRLLLDPCAERGGDPRSVVGRSGVEHDDFAAERGQRCHAAADAVGFVHGDDDAGERWFVEGAVHARIVADAGRNRAAVSFAR